MKKSFKSLFVIIAAMVTFAGCQKEENNAPAAQTKTVEFFAESIETKTQFGPSYVEDSKTKYPTLWTANDESIYVQMNGSGSASSSLTVSDDFKEARFEVDLKDDGSGSYKFLALSPSSVKNSMSASVISANIWASQTPLENSVHEAAQVLYAVSDVYTEFPSSVALTFKHFTAYGKLSFTNLNLNGAKVTSVAVTSSVNFAGRWNYNVEDGSFIENSGSPTITLKTTSTENIWFACAPVGSMNGKTLKFTINTDKGPLSKEVTLSGDKYKFEAGKIAKMEVDMAGIEFAESVAYDLVTDVAELTAGSKIIIAAKDYNYALGTTQNNNNRGQAAVTKVENTIKDPGNDVQVITIEEGSVAGTFAFNVGNAYLYAASSGSNYLRTEQALSANSSWSIEIASDGTATMIAKGTNTRNTMQYNPSSSLFACYGSASQKALAIYKLPGSGTVLENYLNVSPESIEVDADATSASFTVSSDLQWTATSEDATVTIDGNTVTVTFDANTVEEVKTYTVTVTANGVDPKTVTITQKAWVDTSVITPITVKEFCELSDGETIYELTGRITSVYQVYSSEFKNISVYIKDETGEVLIYRLSCEGITDPANTITVGDEITVQGTKTTYNNSAQMNAGGVIVSHKDACAAPVITCAENIVTIKAEDGATIYYTTDGTDPSTGSTVYSDPFSITKTEVVKAIAVSGQKLSSLVAEKSCTWVDPNKTSTTVEKSSFSATSASMDAVVSYTTAKGGGTSNPAVNSSQIRLYQNSAGTGGGTITITAKEGYTLSSVTIGSGMATKIAYTIGTSTTKSESASLVKNGTYTVNGINASSITFYCMGTSSSTRLYVNYLSATYTN